MNRLPELEIGLSFYDPDSFQVELRFNDPQAQELRAPARGFFHPPEALLLQHALNPQAYGVALFTALLADPALLGMYDQSRALMSSSGTPLRVRLFIHPDAATLHNIRWETLYDERPGGGWLLTGENLRFSRFLSSNTWERVLSRARADLRVLVVIANPRDLAAGKFVIADETLAEVDVAYETSRAQQGLGELFSAQNLLISDPASPGKVTLEELQQRLREGYDIVYLACHGALLRRSRKPGAHILLEKPDGSGEFVHAENLVHILQDMTPELRPRLMVLASCQSAGTGKAGVSNAEPASADADGALAALGPLLAQAGVPAVIAMQGSVTMQTASDFVTTFFKELRADENGQIDRAVAVARSAVQRRPDAWMPVLYTRLLSGSLWYQPGFSRAGPDFYRWPGVVTSLKLRKNTPILGAGLSASLLGSPHDIATQWAEEFSYPLLEEGRDQLPEVAQYLANLQSNPMVPRLKLTEMIEARLTEIFKLSQPAARKNWLNPELLTQVGAQLLDNSPQAADLPARLQKTYATLAQLPVPVYISNTPDILLEAALTALGKQPVVEYLRWNSDLGDLPSNLPQGTEPYQPDEQHPLVFHLFGVISEPTSLVVSEDDYFDYLMWINQPGAEIPPMVSRAWAVNALMFLGFNLSDWQFRVLFRSLPIYERLGRRDTQPSLAVQINPDETNLDPEGARSYLEQYFLGVKMGMYWGSSVDFCQQLDQICTTEGIIPRRA